MATLLRGFAGLLGVGFAYLYATVFLESLQEVEIYAPTVLITLVLGCLALKGIVGHTPDLPKVRRSTFALGRVEGEELVVTAWAGGGRARLGHRRLDVEHPHRLRPLTRFRGSRPLPEFTQDAMGGWVLALNDPKAHADSSSSYVLSLSADKKSLAHWSRTEDEGEQESVEIKQRELWREQAL